MQLLLPIKSHLYYTKENWIVGEHNIEATSMVIDSEKLPFLWIAGDKESGKTHLANIWKDRFNAKYIDETFDYHELKKDSCVVFEDIDKCFDEEYLFHLFNTLNEKKISILFTSRSIPIGLNFKLKDLISRLKTVPIVYLKNPDDDGLFNILIHQLKKRGIYLNEFCINFILNRTERSIKGLNRWLDKIEQKCSKISIQLLRDIEKELY